jgi:undecaprenyl phosphate-alpha-L-ara4FN deformylase
VDPAPDRAAPQARRVALKIDVDTLRGTATGVPALLDELERAGIRATFFFSVGPDRSGRAVFRFFTKPGFAAKMLRTNAARMYGWRTALYGTLLPAPHIGERCRSMLRRCADAGHEVGLHAWDHTTWQDRLHHLPPQAVAELIDRGIEEFETIFGHHPRSFAAPAWWSTDTALALLAERGFAYLSMSRGTTGPFRPVLNGHPLNLIEIPTSLPTFDEELGREGTTEQNYVDRLTARYRAGTTEVLTVHAETEGIAFRPLFAALLAHHCELGVEALTLGQVATEARATANLAVRPLVAGNVAGRAGAVMVPGDPLAMPDGDASRPVSS